MQVMVSFFFFFFFFTDSGWVFSLQLNFSGYETMQGRNRYTLSTQEVELGGIQGHLRSNSEASLGCRRGYLSYPVWAPSRENLLGDD